MEKKNKEPEKVKRKSYNPDGRTPIGIDVLPKGWKEKLLEAASNGASMEEMRHITGLKNNTFYAMQKREPELAEVIEEATALAKIWYEKRGREMMKGSPGNATAWIFAMKNKFGWRDKADVDVRTPDGVEVKQKLTLDDFYAKPSA